MAPIFGENARPRQKPSNTIGNANQPQFTFNAPRSSQSNFFRNPDSPLGGLSQPTSSLEESWDMGDDASDVTEVDVDTEESGALSTFRDEGSFNMISGQEPEFYNTELLAFALRLEQSKILRMPQDLKEDQTPPSGYDLISRLQDFAAHHIGDMARAVETLTNSSPGNARNAELDLMASELRYWEMEHQTWKLFGSLMTHRLRAPENPKDVPLDLVNDRFASNGRIRDYLYENDPIFRELVLVLKWLKDYAPEPTIDDVESDGMYRGDRGWMYTKEKLKSNKRLHPGKQLSLFGVSARTRFMLPTSTRNLITELDPDAPVRQQRQLEAEDEGWERYLMKLIWAFLRRGDLTSAQELCEDAGELWRAVSLRGGDDAWDTRIDGGRDGEEDDVVGNRRRELWRRMCFAIAHRRGGDDYEKAVYGTLCGDVESVIPVCETWEDFLFAHVNSLVEGYYSSTLATLTRFPAAVTKFPSFDSIAYHSRGASLEDDETVMPRVIDSIGAVQQLHDSRLPLRTIQSCLISSRFHVLVAELDRQLERYQADPDYDSQADEETISGCDVSDFRLLRVVAHMLIVLQVLDAGFTEGSEFHKEAENVIAGYIMLLGSMEKWELIPLYASRLTPAMATQVLGKSLLDYNGPEDKRDAIIKQMQSHYIDVDSCLRRTAELALEMTAPLYSRSVVSGHGLATNGFTDELRAEDIKLIHGLEWLALGKSNLHGELVRKGCEVYKRFLVTGRLSAAKELHEKINSKEIIPPEQANGFVLDMMIDVPGELTSNVFEDDESRLAAAVYVELESVISAILTLQNWRDVLQNRPERMDRAYKAKLKAAYGEVENTVPEVVKTLLDEPAIASLPSIPTVRNIYIPELVLALHRFYVEAGKYMEPRVVTNALDLATVVADPERNILDTFRATGRLAEYVEQVAGASRNVLGAAQEGAKEAQGIWTVGK